MAALFLACAPQAFAIETLKEALETTYMTNPELLAERLRLRAVDEGVNQAAAGWKPVIFLSGGLGATHTETKAPPLAVVKNDDTSWDASITASQPIFSPTTGPAFQRAKALVRAGRAALLSTEQRILLAAITAYVDVLRDDALVALNRDQVNVLKRELQAANDRFEVGEITRTDTAQAEARYQAAISDLVAAEANLDISRDAYERIVGHLPDGLKRPPLPPLPPSEDQAQETAHKENPALNQLREQEDAAEHGIDLAIGGLLPSVDVQATYLHSEDFGAFGGETDRSTIEGVISVPLYQGGAEYSDIRESKALASQARMLTANQDRVTTESVRNTWELLRAAHADIAATAEQVRANEVALEGVSQEAQVGSRTVLDVLNAQFELRNARAQLIISQRNEVVAAYALLAAMGALTAQKMGLDVEIYDPVAKYEEVAGSWFGTGSSD